MSAAFIERIHLPSGRSVQVCSVCRMDPPHHEYYCPTVASWPRSRVLRAMIDVLDDVCRLERLLVWPAPAERITRELFLQRNRFWDWAHWLGFDFWTSTAAQRAEIRAEVERERTRALPPWKRRSQPHHATYRGHTP